MAGETKVTLVGNLTRDPELRFTHTGAAVANFTVATSTRKFVNNEWVDADTMFIDCSVWRQYAEHVAESLTKGMRVIVTGNLRSRSFESRDGKKVTVFEVDVEEVGPALRYATAQVTRSSNNGGQGGSWQGQQSNQGGGWSSGGDSSSNYNRGGDDPWGQADAQDAPPPF